MLDFLLILIAVSLTAVLFAIGHKYHIDTRSTIAELSKERKLYQKMAWQEIEGRESFLKGHLKERDEHLAIIRNILLESGLAISAIQSIEDISESDKQDIISKLGFVSMYSDKFSSNDGKPLRNGSPPGVERRF